MLDTFLFFFLPSFSSIAFTAGIYAAGVDALDGIDAREVVRVIALRQKRRRFLFFPFLPLFI